MLDFASMSLAFVIALFVIVAAVVCVAGTRIARLADVIADASG